MRTKYTTENAGGTSAADKITAIIDKIDDLQYELFKLNCLAHVAETTVNNILFSQRGDNDRPSFYYAGEGERKVLGFAANEVLCLSNATDAVVDYLLDSLGEVRDMLGGSYAVTAPTSSMVLENAIAVWERAYSDWVKTRKGDNIPHDTAEARAESKALGDLVEIPCETLADVRHKARLFSDNEYLREIATHHVQALMRSYSAATIA